MMLSNLDTPLSSINVSQRVKTAINFLKNLDKNIPDGKVEIDDKNIFALVATVKTEHPDKRFFEAHRDYIDVQFVIDGRQIIEWMPVTAFKEEKNYDEDNDLYKFNQNFSGSKIIIGNNNYAIFFPEDAHKPLCFIDEASTIKICVIKVRC